MSYGFILFTKLRVNSLRVRLIRRMEKWEDRKWREDGKVRRQKRFQFSSFMFGWEGGKVDE